MSSKRRIRRRLIAPHALSPQILAKSGNLRKSDSSEWAEVQKTVGRLTFRADPVRVQHSNRHSSCIAPACDIGLRGLDQLHPSGARAADRAGPVHGAGRRHDFVQPSRGPVGGESRGVRAAHARDHADPGSCGPAPERFMRGPGDGSAFLACAHSCELRLTVRFVLPARNPRSL